MPKRVLDIGNCGPDHMALKRLIERSFDASLDAADQWSDARRLLSEQPYDLVIVNRKLDVDYSDGMEIIRQIKADPQWAEVPVMLLSNFPEAQDEAVAAGALAGFGKSQLGAKATHQRLSEVLA